MIFISGDSAFPPTHRKNVNYIFNGICVYSAALPQQESKQYCIVPFASYSEYQKTTIIDLPMNEIWC